MTHATGAEPGGSAPCVLRGFSLCCFASCCVASRGFLLCGVARALCCRVGASCRRMKPRPPLRASSPHRVKPTPPLRAHNSTIQANYGTQGRCRFHTFPRAPSHGGIPANSPRSRRPAASCRSALLGRGTTVAPLTCSRQPRPTGFRHLRGQEPHRHGPDRRARRGVQRRIG